MKIVTINQRCVYNRDGIQSFVHRGIILCDKIESERPDVIGFQEYRPKWEEHIEKYYGDKYEIFNKYRAADRPESSPMLCVSQLFIAARPPSKVFNIFVPESPSATGKTLRALSSFM